MSMFSGTLKMNEVYSDLFNTIIRHTVFSDNIYDTKSSLLDMSRIDGGLYGDQALFTSFDIQGTREWLGDAEAANLLDVNRNETEVTQSIVLDTFRQCDITLDSYLSKRAWQNETAFSQFNSALLQSINDSKRCHDTTTYNTFIGTNETDIGKQEVNITIGAEPTGEVETEAYNRLTAQSIATKMADLLVELSDISRDYNDLQYIRSYNTGDLVVIFNSAWKNMITKLDLPSLFHKDGLIDKFDEYTLPARYFGKVNTVAGTTPASNLSIRYMEEHTIGTGKDKKVYFAGDLVPANTRYEANETYTEDPTIAFKIMHKRSVPFMSGFNSATEFWNPRALLSNNYITWGYNTLEHLKQYPFITARVNPAA